MSVVAVNPLKYIRMKEPFCGNHIVPPGKTICQDVEFPWNVVSFCRWSSLPIRTRMSVIKLLWMSNQSRFSILLDGGCTNSSSLKGLVVFIQVCKGRNWSLKPLCPLRNPRYESNCVRNMVFCWSSTTSLSTNRKTLCRHGVWADKDKPYYQDGHPSK